ncbi:MAG: methyltransferase domain-containing protein [Bryobacterales bacterium]|nr:methyltransferase domain-containing protein [Bryobacterales bacterium]
MNERTFNAAGAHKLEDPERLVWLPPAEVLNHLRLEPGMCVADIGAGAGYFAIPIALRIAPGPLFAVDFQPEMLARLREKLSRPDMPANLQLVEGSAHKTNLPSDSCDRILMANLWHELDEHPGVLREAARLLRPGGLLVILDWRHDVDRPPGPPLEHRIRMEDAVYTLEHSGFTVQGYGRVGSYNYLITASVSDESVQT